jgi:GntR family transcriptional regulator/MocR family aminotransferase
MLKQGMYGARWMSLRIDIDRSSKTGLRDQIHFEISRHILDGILEPGVKLPSCRHLARELSVSLNTVLGSYNRLLEGNLIESKQRSGYFVRKDLRITPAEQPKTTYSQVNLDEHINGGDNSVKYSYIPRPANWRDFPYPFVCGQIDVNRFPLAEWRECTRLAMNKRDLSVWSGDNFYQDSEELLEQIKSRILPRRGIYARPQEILITMGAQQALYIAASILRGKGKVVAIEDPCYPETREILNGMYDDVRPIPVDQDGMIVDDRLKGVDLVCITANRQFPTTASMSSERRQALLKMANQENFLIIEDDYESDVDYRNASPLALQREDQSGRVIYITSLSKGLAPGLRIGFMIANEKIIDEARASRGLMIRNPPMILQNTAALFLRFGHYDALLSSLHNVFERRWNLTQSILHKEFSDFEITGAFGGTTFVLEDPQKRGISTQIVKRSLDEGLVIEAIANCFCDRREGENYFRLGVSSVPVTKIEGGLAILRSVLNSI